MSVGAAVGEGVGVGVAEAVAEGGGVVVGSGVPYVPSAFIKVKLAPVEPVSTLFSPSPSAFMNVSGA